MKAVRKIYHFYFSSDREFARRMQEVTGYFPSNPALLKRAFFHKSTLNGQHNNGFSNNERLEYLGDAVLGTIVAEYLFTKYPISDEGFLTKMRSKIVKRKMLNDLASDMGLDLLLQEFNTTKISSSMLGNAFEALIGAVYLDLGYNKTRDFVIRRILHRYLDIHELETIDDNFKSQLLEWCQKQGVEVEFKVLSRFKHDNRDRFKVAVCIDEEQVSVAEDYNKKSAEQHAAEKALHLKGVLTSV